MLSKLYLVAYVSVYVYVVWASTIMLACKGTVKVAVGIVDNLRLFEIDELRLDSHFPRHNYFGCWFYFYPLSHVPSVGLFLHYFMKTKEP